MKAAVLYGPKDLRITEFPEPPMNDTSVKIAVSYCGLCGTDFHKYAGNPGARPVSYPVPLGHEISGVVVEIGTNVKNFKIGDRVTVDPNWSCGHCHYCHDGKQYLCENSRGVVKGMAEYICPPEQNVYHLPDTLSLQDASLTEPLACCVHGMDLLDLKLGETVVIIGLGAIGQLMLQLCKHASAGNIVVIEPIEEKREIAQKLGATLFINPTKEDPGDTIRCFGIPRVDKVIECVGLPATAEMALKIADRGATVLLFGVAGKNDVLPVNLYDAFYKELVIKTSYCSPATTSRSIALLNSGAIDTESSCYVIPLEDLIDEIQTRKLSRLGKVIVQINV